MFIQPIPSPCGSGHAVQAGMHNPQWAEFQQLSLVFILHFLSLVALKQTPGRFVLKAPKEVVF
jgi:hypothetical protein